MAFVVMHQRKDGSREVVYHDREGHEHNYKPVNPVCGRSENQRLTDLRRDLVEFRKSMKNKKGWDRSKTLRHVARIPVEVQHYVLRNEGVNAANDTKHLIKTAQKLGLEVRTGGGNIR